MTDPHQPVGNEGGDVVNVNTPIPTEEERALYANAPTTAEAELSATPGHDSDVQVHTPPNTGRHGDAPPLSPLEQAPAHADLEQTPEHVESEGEDAASFQADLDSKPTTAEEQVLESADGEATEQTPEHDQQEEGEHRLEASAGQATEEQVEADHGSEHKHAEAEQHDGLGI